MAREPDGETRPAPWREQSIVYDGAGEVLAIHSTSTFKDGEVAEQTAFERPVDLPDETLARRAHDDLVLACHAAVGAAPTPLAGARLWQVHGPEGAMAAFEGFELCPTLDDLLGASPDDLSPVFELPVVASWSRRTIVQALEQRLVERGDNDMLDDFVVGVVRALNERLEREHGATGPVVLRCIEWVDEDAARPALTDAQWARWLAEGWTARIAPFPG